MQENAAPGPLHNVTWFRENQRAAVSDFWRAYEGHLCRTQASTLEWMRGHLELRLAEPVTDLQIIEENQRNQAILARAMQGDAGLYRAQLSGAGRRYAELGVSITAACDLACGFRRTLLPRLVELYGGEPARLCAAIQAMNDFADYGTALVTNAFIGHKEVQSKNREEDLATTLDSIGDAVIVTDGKGCVVRMNPVAERLLGVALASCHGCKLDEVFRAEDEETGEPLESPYRRVLRDGAVVGLTSRGVLTARDGVRRPIAHSCAPVRSEAGGVRGVVLVFRDVGEERRAEEQLKHWQRIFQHATWGVAVASADDLRFQAVNPMYAAMHGYTAEELIGAPLSTVWTKETGADMENHAPFAHEHGQLVVETMHRRKDGTLLPVEIVATTIKDAAQQRSWFVANVNDITERRRHQRAQLRAVRLEAEHRRIQEANRLKSEFLASMSHELRTPLNSIIGFAELIFDGHVGSITDKQKEFMGDILAGGRHLLRLINEVLDLAKVEAGKMEFRPEPSDLRQLASAVVQSLRATALSKNLDVALTVEPTLEDIVLDPGRFKQILYNYLSNALKFTPEGGRVGVRASAESEDQFRLEVEDTGPGISNEDTPRLFNAFQQLDTGVAKRHGGTGLGLALTKQLVEAQGGTVGVRPAVAGGSVFFAVLPRRASESAAPGSRESGMHRPASVLVVERNFEDQRVVVSSLKDAGYDVDAVSTCKAAQAAWSSRSYDALTLDLLDREGDDVSELLRLVRQAPKSNSTPVIAMTLVGDRQAPVGFAVTDVLDKPVEPAALLAALRRSGVPPGRGRPVFVIDDDAGSLKLMEATLAKLGYEALSFSDAHDALRAAATVRPLAVILDLVMPAMDGLAFLRRFRATPENSAIPVMIWTVKDMSREEQESLQAAATAVVQKGAADSYRLATALQRLFDTRGLTKQVE